VAAEARLAAAGLETTGVDDTQCCYAQKTATWPSGPDGARWQWYVKTGDSEQLANLVVNPTGGGCCPRLSLRSSPARSEQAEPAARVGCERTTPAESARWQPRAAQRRPARRVRPRPGVAYRRRPPPGGRGYTAGSFLLALS
jgi:hypothetical protein